MLSPARTGEEKPGGTSVFHTTFLAGPNSTGRFRFPETPAEFGPRNCSQSSAQRGVMPSRTIAKGISLFIRPRIKTIQEIWVRGTWGRAAFAVGTFRGPDRCSNLPEKPA